MVPALMTTMNAAVSFAQTPLEEISRKVEEIKALGWSEREHGARGDPWAASFVKDFPDHETGKPSPSFAS
jgi:hypothetical protein